MASRRPRLEAADARQGALIGIVDPSSANAKAFAEAVRAAHPDGNSLPRPRILHGSPTTTGILWRDAPGSAPRRPPTPEPILDEFDAFAVNLDSSCTVEDCLCMGRGGLHFLALLDGEPRGRPIRVVPFEHSGDLVQTGAFGLPPMQTQPSLTPDDARLLAARVVAVADLNLRGWIFDPTTQDALFLIGRRGTRVPPEHVLLFGPTGSGKEGAAHHLDVIARATSHLEQMSPSYSGQEMTVVHCGGLRGDRAREELFGADANHFSSVPRHSLGRLVAALGIRPVEETELRGVDFVTVLERAFLNEDGTPAFHRVSAADGVWHLNDRVPVATVFLDEFQDLDSETQSLLLRAIEHGDVFPLGTNFRVRLADQFGLPRLRFMCGTNDPRIVNSVKLKTPPAEQSNHDTVRLDLAMRVAQWILELPPLSPDEVDALIDAECRRMKAALAWSPDARKTLRDLVAEHAGLPGGRRQLCTMVRRAVATASEQRALGRVRSPMQAVSKDIIDAVVFPLLLRPSSANRDVLHDDRLRRTISTITSLPTPPLPLATLAQTYDAFPAPEVLAVAILVAAGISTDGHLQHAERLLVSSGGSNTLRKHVERALPKGQLSALLATAIEMILVASGVAAPNADARGNASWESAARSTRSSVQAMMSNVLPASAPAASAQGHSPEGPTTR